MRTLLTITALSIAPSAAADLEVFNNSDGTFSWAYFNDNTGFPTGGNSLDITKPPSEQSSVINLEVFWGLLSFAGSSSGLSSAELTSLFPSPIAYADRVNLVPFHGFTMRPPRNYGLGESVSPGDFTGQPGWSLFWETFATGPLTQGRAFEDTGTVGVSFEIDGQTHYGWIRFALRDDIEFYNIANNYKITAWAYETEPGVPALVVDHAPTCLADTNGDGALTPADFSAWIIAFNAGTNACDQNGDGQCMPNDFNAWIANYNDGC